MAGYAELFPQIAKKVSYLFGEGVCMSFPVPDIVKGKKVERFFLYRATPEICRVRPFAVLVTSMETGQILAYSDSAVEDYFENRVYPLAETLNYTLPLSFSVKAYRVRLSLLEKLYEYVRQRVFEEQPTLQDKQIMDCYMLLLEQMSPRELMPYYQAIGENFFKWRDAYAG